MKNTINICTTLVVAFLFATGAKSQTTYKIASPVEATALKKLKESENFKSRLNEAGLTAAEVTIKLKKQEAFIPSSDEVCYQIYRDSKKIEGSNYDFTYLITSKANKFGDSFTTLAHVYYTRVDITQTTCNILPSWQFEYATVDAFSLNSTSGLISVSDAEKQIFDTIQHGFNLDAYHQSENDYSNIQRRKWETCRIDALKTCEFGKNGCSEYYQVKNELWEQTHIICFETVIYRGEYETGAVMYGSMYRVLKYKSLIYCEFQRKEGKTRLINITVSDLGSEEFLPENTISNRPLDVYYNPITKVKIQEISGKFSEGTPDQHSILHFANSFSGMADYFTANLTKDYATNLAVFSKYFTPAAAERSAKEYTDKVAQGYKFSPWTQQTKPEKFGLELTAECKQKKGTPTTKTLNVVYLNVRFINGSYFINDPINL